MPGHYRRLVAAGHRTSGHWTPQNAEKLEFSRRYWLATGVTDWRVYVYGGEGKLVETHDQSLC